MRCDGNGGTHRQSAGSQLPALTVEETALGQQLLPKTQANGPENLTIESSNVYFFFFTLSNSFPPWVVGVGW